MWRKIALMTAFAALAAPVSAMPQLSPVVQYELGVDVSRVTPTSEGVNLFLSGLSTDQRTSVMGKCQYFMDNPSAMKTMETAVFCSIATQAGTHAVL